MPRSCGSSSAAGSGSPRSSVRDSVGGLAAGRFEEGIQQADAAVEELDGGDRLLGLRSDVADLDDIDALADTLRDRYGRLDVLFANAGVAAFQPTADITEAEFDKVVDINFKGVFFTVQKTLPLLADHAAVVVNASWALHRGVPGASLYSATKAAVHNLTRALAAELAPRGIRVNSVSPGYIETPSYRDNVSPEAKAAAITAVAAGRLGTPEDIADAVAFLASPEASYINGQDLLVDGGLITAIPERML
ncbi:SDR family NAD(P)-dependent oxidoreductase [Nocardia sp. bgisy134]|uniref:SDR family NAD(P)-dependent oxidoreductase n=1 Tax=Nocardia sp. bgisy134 TaxID=3413789 RepID=UPI003D716CE3